MYIHRETIQSTCMCWKTLADKRVFYPVALSAIGYAQARSGLLAFKHPDCIILSHENSGMHITMIDTSLCCNHQTTHDLRQIKHSWLRIRCAHLLNN